MPIVPKYGPLQVTPLGGLSVRATAPTMPDIGAQQSQQHFGGVVGKIIDDILQRDNQLRVDDARNQVVQPLTELQLDMLQQKGRNALERPSGKSLPEEYREKLQKVVDKISSSLGNDDQRYMFQQQAKQMQQQFYSAVSSHMVSQREVFRKETQKATIDTATNQGTLLWKDKDMRKQSVGAIQATIEQMAAERGWDKTIKDAHMAEAISPLHVGIMKSMIQDGAAAEAQEYYDTNSASMTLQARAHMQSILSESVDSQLGEKEANLVWTTKGPKSVNDAVRLLVMEDILRRKLENKPAALREGIRSLRERAQAHGAEQTQIRAQNVADVWKQMDSGASIESIYRSDSWLSLTATERMVLGKQLTSEGDRRSLERNIDKYLITTDPNVLVLMTRTQVEAQRGYFGPEITKQLLNKWESLQKQGGLQAAEITATDINYLAYAFGLKPNSTDDEDRIAFVNFKHFAEHLVGFHQQQQKHPLSPTEINRLISREMAKKVIVDPWGWKKGEVSVGAITRRQLEYVKIPSADRKKVIAIMKEQRAENPRDPRYALTDANIASLYLEIMYPEVRRFSYGERSVEPE